MMATPATWIDFAKIVKQGVWDNDFIDL